MLAAGRRRCRHLLGSGRPKGRAGRARDGTQAKRASQQTNTRAWHASGPSAEHGRRQAQFHRGHSVRSKCERTGWPPPAPRRTRAPARPPPGAPRSSPGGRAGGPHEVRAGRGSQSTQPCRCQARHAPQVGGGPTRAGLAAGADRAAAAVAAHAGGVPQGRQVWPSSFTAASQQLHSSFTAASQQLHSSFTAGTQAPHLGALGIAAAARARVPKLHLALEERRARARHLHRVVRPLHNCGPPHQATSRRALR
jgi:hypothetical protein